MVTFKVTCPEHGESSIKRDDVRIKMDTSGRMNMYEFKCATEQSQEIHTQQVYTQPSIIRLMVASQVIIEYYDSTLHSILPQSDLQDQILAAQRAADGPERHEEIFAFVDANIEHFNQAVQSELNSN